MDATTLVFPILKYVYEYHKGKYTKRILEELSNGILNKTEALKNSEIYKFCLFQDSLERASTYEKANLLKTLYLSLNNEETASCSDDLFFEIFSILGELSDREIKLLYLLEIYSNNKMKDKSSDNEKYGKYFVLMAQNKSNETFGDVATSDVFYYFAAEKIKSEPKIVEGLMKRLERTGLITPTGLDCNALFQEYRHTALYSEIRSRIILAMESCYNENLLLTSSDI